MPEIDPEDWTKALASSLALAPDAKNVLIGVGASAPVLSAPVLSALALPPATPTGGETIPAGRDKALHH